MAVTGRYPCHEALRAMPLDRPFLAKEMTVKISGSQLSDLADRGLLEKVGRSGTQGRRFLWKATAKLIAWRANRNDAR